MLELADVVPLATLTVCVMPFTAATLAEARRENERQG
jgi:hypothetical protein